MKKFLAVFLILIAFFLWSPSWVPAVAPVGKALVGLSAVQQFIYSEEVREYEYTDPDFQMLMVLTSYYYSRVTGSPVGFDSGFVVLRVTGDLAGTTEQKCGCRGYTIPEQKIVVVLADQYSIPAEEMRIVSHELTHVLQVVNGKLSTMPKIMIEYQAEIISRFVMSVWTEAGMHGSLDSRNASPLALERFNNSLQAFEAHKSLGE